MCIVLHSWSGVNGTAVCKERGTLLVATAMTFNSLGFLVECMGAFAYDGLLYTDQIPRGSSLAKSLFSVNSLILHHHGHCHPGISTSRRYGFPAAFFSFHSFTHPSALAFGTTKIFNKSSTTSTFPPPSTFSNGTFLPTFTKPPLTVSV